MDPHPDDNKLPPRTPVIRGARACTTCRAAKMKCVGSDDGQKQCQRCKRANVECVFEKHRRGRKPGSKLSEASKMLRKLEKGLSNAKLKSHGDGMQPYGAPRPSGAYTNGAMHPEYGSPNSHFASNELPPLQFQNGEYPGSSNSSRTMDVDDDDDDRNEEALFPAKLIRKENKRNSFFRTILNDPNEEPASVTPQNNRRLSYSPSNPHPSPISPPVPDPISAGIIDEGGAKILFDLIFLRLNPFVNLFDPALHTVPYIRSRCPLLFSTLIMAGSKFFRPELYKDCQKLTNELRIRAFAEGWKRVEVVQAFACLTYWREPDDNCTWTYIGYACRMAVELGLNRYVSPPPPNETEFQLLERRNRERTYLVLFVHDRSLSTQTGRNWMLPEDELVCHSMTWHEDSGTSIRPEDVILAAFVQLRRMAAETTDRELFSTANGSARTAHTDLNYDIVLRNCNVKLTQWMDTWKREMDRASGEPFHFAFLSYFRLYVRLFLNSFGVHGHISSPNGHAAPSVQALSVCYTSAIDSLRIVSKDFANINVLRYGQETITTMSAYSAVFLLKLLRSPNTQPHLHEGAAREIHAAITQTADAYHEASLSPASSAAAYHSRFLRSLLANNDIFNARNMPQIDPRLQGPTETYPQAMSNDRFQFPASPHLPIHPVAPELPQHSFLPHNTQEDAQYWKNMFTGLGFGEAPSPAYDPRHNGFNQQQQQLY
ncbi:fungal-specific transcription factor domain-containing protein [Mycena floridula]|nr:fungal-specific transcription factor domain-containing protein [Mycena floridula]